MACARSLPFAMDLERLYWVDECEDNVDDLCLHGDVVIRIGDVEVKETATVSAAGLRLLRSLFHDHVAGVGEQLFPCCGHTMLADPQGETVEILGCEEGLDWSVHHDGESVTITTDEGVRVTCAYADYEAEVLRFANAVEAFYAEAKERVLPDDPVERAGYEAFWKEWRSCKRECVK